MVYGSCIEVLVHAMVTMPLLDFFLRMGLKLKAFVFLGEELVVTCFAMHLDK